MALRRSRSQRVTEFIRCLDSDAYKLVGCCGALKTAPSRLKAARRPSTLVPYVNGNFHFVYKNCSQVDPKNMQKDWDDLNDVLFSHCFFAETGVQWNLLFCLISCQPSDYVCPICLDIPVAPRITRCGHIFCSDCMKAFFDLSASHRCPICYEPVIQSEIQRCVLRTYDANAETLRFVKLTRKGGTCLCYRDPITTISPASECDSLFTRFSIADTKFITDVYTTELNALETQLQVYQESKIDDRIAYIKDIEKSITSDVVKQDDTKFVLGESYGPDVVFYQSEDGRYLFLDDINVDMLIESFGSLSKAPDVIEAKILNSQALVIGESDVRSDSEFSHLPSGAEIKLVLVDLSGIVSSDVMAKFRAKIKRKTVRKKPAATLPEGPVITKDDYQKFVAIDAEEAVNLLDESVFPAWGTPNPPKRKLAKAMDVKEDFPELLPRSVKKKTYAKPFYRPPEPEKPKEDLYPTLTGRPEVTVQKPKKASAWANLKL